jgi:hypothetical protein
MYTKENNWPEKNIKKHFKTFCLLNFDEAQLLQNPAAMIS